MNCEFCGNLFKNAYVLKSHQKRAKYCILIQNNTGEPVLQLYTCEFCSLQMAHDNNTRHITSCKKRASVLLENANNQIKELEKVIIKKDIEIAELKKDIEIAELKKGNIIYKELSDRELSCIEDIAKQPRTQTNNTQNNTLMMLTPMDMNQESFAKTITESFTKDYFLDGQKGAARFAVEKLLTDENGKLKYICTDPSRQIYRFKAQDGSLERDVKAKKLTMALSGNLTKKSHSITAGEIANGDTDIFVIYTTNFQDIQDMSNDNGEFRSELASLTTR